MSGSRLFPFSEGGCFAVIKYLIIRNTRHLKLFVFFRWILQSKTFRPSSFVLQRIIKLILFAFELKERSRTKYYDYDHKIHNVAHFIGV